MKLKHPSNSASQSLTSSDTRLLVRESLRISADLASAAPPSPPAAAKAAQERPLVPDSSFVGLVKDQFLDSSLRLICCEEVDGRRWQYLAENSYNDGIKSSSAKQSKKNSIRAVSLQTPQAPIEELMTFIRSYVVPEGFPDSVTPSYVPYMTWRALKHFFGGAMGVFTTQTLLSSLGVSRNTTSGAVAINWILKDGAGRVGKMLFARQGKKFDYDLKQLRFAGDLLMELGAGVELATAAVPHLFLPLACAANVAKNVSAVTSTSTRTPIYKAFAKGENIGDVTAKGECVGNIADLLGTGLSIVISKRNPSLFTTFALLSCGYLMSSYKEVKSVVLHTLNRARFTVAVESFLSTGPRFKDAFQDPNSYLTLEPIFEKERYIVTCNPSKGKIYALFKDQAKSDDILKAAFHAHVLLHIICSSNQNSPTSRTQEHDLSVVSPTLGDLQSHIAESYKMVSALYEPFKNKTKEQGWVMSESLLNPGRARLCFRNEIGVVVLGLWIPAVGWSSAAREAALRLSLRAITGPNGSVPTFDEFALREIYDGLSDDLRVRVGQHFWDLDSRYLDGLTDGKKEVEHCKFLVGVYYKHGYGLGFMFAAYLDVVCTAKQNIANWIPVFILVPGAEVTQAMVTQHIHTALVKVRLYRVTRGTLGGRYIVRELLFVVSDVGVPQVFAGGWSPASLTFLSNTCGTPTSLTAKKI
ncbi:hypothetical protein STAS_05095 [Striga asiatica]|uniref:Protein root UVB sensitive 6 n=1 Tax=Striga asiatica TaxID=4170 RepID=A0A5A7P8T1_STRAF|nr:hypothetical protein STAS_05095 [Striga asiatica]